MHTSFDRVQYFLSKAMSAERLRFKVISNNIANIDTPNFKRSDVVFESILKKAMKRQNNLKLSLTHDKHIGSKKGMSERVEGVVPKIILEHQTSYRNDKNNVDMESESNEFLKSSLRYQAYSSIMSRKFKSLRYILS